MQGPFDDSLTPCSNNRNASGNGPSSVTARADNCTNRDGLGGAGIEMLCSYPERYGVRANPLDSHASKSLAEQVAQRGMRGASEFLGLHRNTISRGLRGQPVSPHVSAVLQTRARTAARVRTAGDFANARQMVVHAPVQQSPVYSWTLEQ